MGSGLGSELGLGSGPGLGLAEVTVGVLGESEGSYGAVQPVVNDVGLLQPGQGRRVRVAGLGLKSSGSG